MAHHVSFEAVETYLHKNVYSSDIIGDKGKKANFSKDRKRFSMENTRLVISYTERQRIIISDIHRD